LNGRKTITPKWAAQGMSIQKTVPEIREAILKTIAFFDLFDYPLTAWEIQKNLLLPAKLGEIIAVLDQETDPELVAEKNIERKNGFYFLNGRAAIIDLRQVRYNYYYRKIKIARRFARLFGFFPFVRAVALANVIGDGNLRDESDLDFFIVTAPRRLWLVRLYCAGLAKVLNRRPTATDKKDKLCLSFYVSEERLNLEDLKLADQDPYFIYWRRNLVLLYNKDRTYERFLAANGLEEESVSTPVFGRNPWLDYLEKISKTWQLKIMPPLLKAANNNSDGVVINDQILKLYIRDRRRQYAEKYDCKIREIFKENC